MEESNILIPVHKKINQEEITSLLKDYNLENVSKLPKISIGDPAIKEMNLETQDVVEIIRQGEFGNEVKYWRVVIE